MKNVTISLDDEVHHKARIRAAELGTSLSALVKSYLTGLVQDGAAPPPGVREMPTPFKHAEPAQGGPPWLVDGQWVYTRDGKPRKPGAARHLPPLPDDWDKWPEDILASFEAWPYDDPDFEPWRGDQEPPPA